MGNRAHIVFTAGGEFSPAVYLHWNGGPESVWAFLDEMDEREVPAGDVSYEAARFVQCVGDFFGGGLSLGIVNGPASDDLEALRPFDHGDNGLYIVDRTTEPTRTVRRFFKRAGGQPFVEHQQWSQDSKLVAEYAKAIAERFETIRGRLRVDAMSSDKGE